MLQAEQLRVELVIEHAEQPMGQTVQRLVLVSPYNPEPQLLVQALEPITLKWPPAQEMQLVLLRTHPLHEPSQAAQSLVPVLPKKPAGQDS